MSQVKIAIAHSPIYTCDGKLYRAIESNDESELEQHIGKYWTVTTVDKIINTIRSNPKWIFLKRKPNEYFDYLESYNPKIIGFTENKNLYVLTLEPLLLNKYYMDSVHDLILPEPIQTCFSNIPLKPYDMNYLPDFDIEIFHTISNANRSQYKSLYDFGFNINVIDISNEPITTNRSFVTQVPIYPNI